MAEAFIGFHVSLSLHSNIKLDGKVAHIDPTTQQMTLNNVTLYFPGQTPHRTPVYGVVGNDIADLQILQTKAPVPVTSFSQPVTSTSLQCQQKQTSEDVSTTVVYSCEEIVQKQYKPRFPAKVNGYIRPTKSLSCTTDRKYKPQQSRQHQRRSAESNGWANEDVNGFKEEEFDFQANLDMFDKEKVFAEIREFDETAAETLLVTLNRLPRKKLAKLEPKQLNLLPTENVLEKKPKPIDSDVDDDDDDGDEDGGCGDESDNESETSVGYDIHRKKRSAIWAKTVSIATMHDNIPCPVVSPLQMAHAEHECVSVIGLSEEQMIENGGRGTYEVTLKILAERKQTNQPANMILVLAGSCKNGAYGLSTARQLLNHGHHVIVCLVAGGDHLTCAATRQQTEMLERLGASILYGIQGLLQVQQCDLIIDAMLGSQTKLIDLQDERAAYLSICDMIQWTNDHAKIPILSIDYPSGVDASTGQHHHPIHYIQPQWTVCLGPPKTGCISSKVTGDLYMVDLGYPRLCWKKAGLKRFTIPWGANFVVGLKYL